MKDRNESLNVLFIGNSYSECTCAYLYDFFKALGVEKFNLASLKISGASIKMHWDNAQSGAGAYRFFHYTTPGDRTVEDYVLADGIATDAWDRVILSGSAVGPAIPDSYDNLRPLVDYVKQRVTPGRTKFVFNMTWPWEKGCAKFEGRFQNDPAEMYRCIIDCAKTQVLTLPEFTGVLPTGTAVYNAVLSGKAPSLYRDGGHLNANGCYLASLAAAYTLLNDVYDGAFPIGKFGLPCLPAEPHRTNGSFIGELDTEYADVYLQAVTEALEKPLGE